MRVIIKFLFFSRSSNFFLSSFIEIPKFQRKLFHLNILRKIFCLGLKVEQAANKGNNDNHKRDKPIPPATEYLIYRKCLVANDRITSPLNGLSHWVEHYQFLKC